MALGLAALVWFEAIALAANAQAQLDEFQSSTCAPANRTAYTLLPADADWSRGRCMGPVDRTELTDTQDTFTLSLRMVCNEDNSVVYNMYSTSPDCSGEGEEADLSASAVEHLFEGKCVAFQPKIAGIPKLYMRLSNMESETKPCTRVASEEAAVFDSSAAGRGSHDDGGLFLSPATMEEGSTTHRLLPKPSTTPPMIVLTEPSTTQSLRKSPPAEESSEEAEENTALAKINAAGSGVSTTTAPVLEQPEPEKRQTTPPPVQAQPQPTPAPLIPDMSHHFEAVKPLLGNVKHHTKHLLQTVKGHLSGFPFPELGKCDELADLTSSSSRSSTAEYLQRVAAWMRSVQAQGVIAALAILIGLSTTWDANVTWRVVFATAAAIIAAVLVNSQVEDVEITGDAVADDVLLIEVALVVGIGVSVGFDGSQVFFGCFMGFLGASRVTNVPAAMDKLSPGFALAWYSLGALLGLVAFTECRRPIVGVLAPILGGLLVASSLGVFISLALESPSEAADFFPASGEAWIDATAALLGPRPQVSLALPCGCALVGLAVHVFREKPVLPVVSAVVGIFGANLAWFLNSGCRILQFQCPEETPWKWFLVGSLVWTAVAAGGIFKNISDIPVGKQKEEFEQKELRALFDKLAPKDGRLEYNDFKYAVQSGVIAPGSKFNRKALIAMMKANREVDKVPGYMKIPQVGAWGHRGHR